MASSEADEYRVMTAELNEMEMRDPLMRDLVHTLTHSVGPSQYPSFRVQLQEN